MTEFYLKVLLLSNPCLFSLHIHLFISFDAVNLFIWLFVIWLTLAHWNMTAMKVTTWNYIHNKYLTRPRQKIFAYIVCTRLVGAPDVLRTWQVYAAAPHLMRLISLKVNDSPRQLCAATGPPPIRSRAWEVLDCFCAEFHLLSLSL
jgi:hypothetical protein